MKAEFPFALEDYAKAAEYYEQAFTKAFPFPEDRLARSYEKLGDKEKQYKAMQQLILHGLKLGAEVLPFIGAIEPFEITQISADDTLLLQRLSIEYDSLQKVFLSNQEKTSNEYMKSLILCENYCRLMRTEEYSEGTINDCIKQIEILTIQFLES